MKYILLAYSLLVGITANAQKLYVHCEDIKSREILENKIKYEGYKITDEKESADYILECKIWVTSKINSMYKGNVSLIDKTGKVIAVSDDVRRGAVAVNGFNASANIYGVIAKKHLPELLKDIKKP